MKKSFSKIKIIKYSAVFGLLVFLYILHVFNPLEKMIISFSNPVLVKLQSFSLKINKSYEEKISDLNLKSENEEKEKELIKLRQDNAKLKVLENENKILRDYLGFLTRNNYNYVMARVISRGDLSSISKQDNFLIVNRGKDDGVYPGLVSIDESGNIIGKVIEVKDKISKIFLINSKYCKLAVSILGEKETYGLIQGDLGLSIKMDFIPQSLNLKEGDLVLSSGLEASVPRGLQVGKIFKINKESNELWQSAFIDPLGDLNNISIVSIIIPELNPDSLKD